MVITSVGLVPRVSSARATFHNVHRGPPAVVSSTTTAAEMCDNPTVALNKPQEVQTLPTARSEQQDQTTAN
eukprot:2298727-Amphidinium_carterae.1